MSRSLNCSLLARWARAEHVLKLLVGRLAALRSSRGARGAARGSITRGPGNKSITCAWRGRIIRGPGNESITCAWRGSPRSLRRRHADPRHLPRRNPNLVLSRTRTCLLQTGPSHPLKPFSVLTPLLPVWTRSPSTTLVWSCLLYTSPIPRDRG